MIRATRIDELPQIFNILSGDMSWVCLLYTSLLARNYDVALGKKDLELYLDRIEQSVPKSVEAGLSLIHI